ncbi:ribosome silencing factor [Candidatus Bipolaricaulota bacterium]|nr:ribosome silencing factor [Candidatus Bipolaricaulota bacterium]
MSLSEEERRDLLRLLEIIEDKKGEQAKVLDMRDHTIATRFFVLANGTNPKHVRALAEEILEKYDRTVVHKEGLDTGSWIVLDYGELMVHLFNEEVRQFYDLDDLWVDRYYPIKKLRTA